MLRIAALMAALVTVAATLFAGSASAQSGLAQCDPATEPAIAFDQLPTRLYWGQRYLFGFTGDDTSVDGSIHVEMASPAGAQPFFAGDIADASQLLYIELDRGNPPGRVTATYAEIEPDATECSRVLTRDVAGTSDPSALPDFACGALRAYYSDHGTRQYVQASHIVASGLFCRRARHIADEWSRHSRLSYRPASSGAGFRCRYNRIGSDVGIVRCTRNGHVVRFNAYDSSPFH